VPEIASEASEGMTGPRHPTATLTPSGNDRVQAGGYREAGSAQPSAFKSVGGECMFEAFHHLRPELGAMG